MRIAIVSPVPTHPTNAGNRRRILSLVDSLQESGHQIQFLYAGYEPADMAAMKARFGNRLHIVGTERPRVLRRFWPRAWRYVARRMGLKMAYQWRVDDWLDPRIADAASDICAANDVETVILEYVFMSGVAERLPKSVRSVIDCHDLFGDRHSVYLKNGLRPDWFSTSIVEEDRALDRANAVIAIQDAEALELSGRIKADVFCVGPMMPIPEHPLPDPESETLLFVGSRNPLNTAAIRVFVQDVWPLILAEMPAAELLLAGECGMQDAWPQGVRCLGNLPSIESAYREGSVVINPVSAGTGFPIKTIEAFSFGRPLVTAPMGMRGLCLQETPFALLASNAEEFAAQCCRLLRDMPLRKDLGLKAYHFAKTWNQAQVISLENALGISVERPRAAQNGPERAGFSTKI